MKKTAGLGLTMVLTASSLYADRITRSAVGCPDMASFRKIRNFEGDLAAKELWIMQVGCRVLRPEDRIHVIDADRKVHGLYLKIRMEGSGETYYVRKEAVKVEQSGRGNILKF